MQTGPGREHSCLPICDSARSRASGTSPIRTSRASRTRGSTTRKSSRSPGSRGPTASSTTCGRRRAWSRVEPAGTVALDLVDAAGAPPSSSQDRAIPRAGDPISGRVALLANDDVTLARCRPDRAAGGAVPQRRRRRGRLRPPRPGHVAHDVRPAAVPRLRLRRHPPLHDLSPRVRARRPSPTCSSSRRPATSRSRRGISTRTASSGWARRTASATCTARARSSVIDREQETPVLIKDGSAADALHAGEPSVRRRRLGRHGLSLHVQRRRLRADHRHGPPAAAGAADVRGAGVRGLHVRPADARHASRGDQGAVRPFERAGRRGPVLCPRPVRQPPGRRGGVDHAASPRHPPRPAPRHDRRQPRRDPDRRAGRHGRHRPAAPADAPGDASWTTRLIP